MDLPDAIVRFLAKPGAEETTPFGPDVLVYKVAGKMFALAVHDDFPSRINLKCDPDRSELLRAGHPAITPGYHMSKRHWNTVVLDGSVPSSLVRELIDHSYDLVVAGLPKAQRAKLNLCGASATAALCKRSNPGSPSQLRGANRTSGASLNPAAVIDAPLHPLSR